MFKKIWRIYDQYSNKRKQEGTSVEYGFYKEDDILYICLGKTGDDNIFMNIIDWVYNFLYFPILQRSPRGKAYIHLAGLIKWKSIWKYVREEIARTKPNRIVLVGYSQGGAVAQIGHYMMYYPDINIQTISFGAPHWLKTDANIDIVRVEYGNDIVTKSIPGIGFKPIGVEYHIGPPRRWWKLSPKDHTQYHNVYG